LTGISTHGLTGSLQNRVLAGQALTRAKVSRLAPCAIWWGSAAATSHEIAAAFGGDDIVVRARGDLIDPTVPAEAMQFLAGLGVTAGHLQSLGGVPGVARLKAEGARADCEVGALVAGCLRLPEAVRQAVLDAFERFDGHGVPAGRTKREIAANW
jgi:hypothetical protein